MVPTPSQVEQLDYDDLLEGVDTAARTDRRPGTLADGLSRTLSVISAISNTPTVGSDRVISPVSPSSPSSDLPPDLPSDLSRSSACGTTDPDAGSVSIFDRPSHRPHYSVSTLAGSSSSSGSQRRHRRSTSWTSRASRPAELDTDGAVMELQAERYSHVSMRLDVVTEGRDLDLHGHYGPPHALAGQTRAGNSGSVEAVHGSDDLDIRLPLVPLRADREHEGT